MKDARRESSTWQERSDRSQDKGRSDSKIFWAYKGQPTFSGFYDEDLKSITKNITKTAESYDERDQEKRRAMFAMLQESAWTLLNSPC